MTVRIAHEFVGADGAKMKKNELRVENRPGNLNYGINFNFRNFKLHCSGVTNFTAVNLHDKQLQFYTFCGRAHHITAP